MYSSIAIVILVLAETGHNTLRSPKGYHAFGAYILNAVVGISHCVVKPVIALIQDKNATVGRVDSGLKLKQAGLCK